MSPLGASALPPQPAGVPADHTEHLRVVHELAARAFQTDATRVWTLLVADEGANRSDLFAGVPEGHQEMSHRGGDAAKLAQYESTCRFCSEGFATFVVRLRASATRPSRWA